MEKYVLSKRDYFRLKEFEFRNRRKRSDYKKLFFKTLAIAFLCFYGLISIYPFFWTVFVSFKNPRLISVTGINPFPAPGEWTLENYQFFTNSPIFRRFITGWITNSIVYSLSTSILNATLNLLAGYALAKIAMRGKKLLVFYLLASILIPSQATFVPTYLIFSRIGVISRSISVGPYLAAIIFSGMANIVLTFMARQFFLTQSYEIEEGARMDGASRLYTFFKITLRKMLPLFATQFVLVFLGSWNAFLIFTLYSAGDPRLMTLTSGTAIVIQDIDRNVGFGRALALTNISFVPVFVIYLISLRIQKRGIKSGAK